MSRHNEVAHPRDRAGGFLGGSGKQATKGPLEEAHRNGGVGHLHMQVILPGASGVKGHSPYRVAILDAVFIRARNPLENLSQPVGLLAWMRRIEQDCCFTVANKPPWRRRRFMDGARAIKIA